MTVLTSKQLLKTEKVNQKNAHNRFHNILGLFDVLPNFPFTASETKGGINMVYTSSLTSWQTTKDSVPRLPLKRKKLLILVKNCWKLEITTSRNLLSHMKTTVSLKYFINSCRFDSFWINPSVQSRHSVYLRVKKEERSIQFRNILWRANLL